jgi:hypothetical protein
MNLTINSINLKSRYAHDAHGVVYITMPNYRDYD